MFRKRTTRVTRPTILPLQAAAAAFIDPAQHPETEQVLSWQAHLDAGRIGGNPPPNPAVTANLLATDALFRSFNRRRPVWERHA
jgi:hypothetical protein